MRNLGVLCASESFEFKRYAILISVLRRDRRRTIHRQSELTPENSASIKVYDKRNTKIDFLSRVREVM